MGKKYNMEDLGLDILVGRRVLSATINSKKDLIVLNTDKGPLFLTWEGECCAECYLAHTSGTEALVEANILDVRNADWITTSSEDYAVTESMGTIIKTTKGYVTLETRVEHNGYYGGRIMVSDDEPMDSYRSPRYDKDLPEMTFLTDF